MQDDEPPKGVLPAADLDLLRYAVRLSEASYAYAGRQSEKFFDESMDSNVSKHACSQLDSASVRYRFKLEE